MHKLEDILKSAKPTVPQLPSNFSEQVMSRIARLETAPARSSVSLLSLLAACFLLLIGLLAVNSILFEVQMNGSMELLSFGTRFLADTLDYIPFDLIIPAILLIGLASKMMWASKAFKKGITAVMVSCYLVTGIGGAALAATGVNERIQNTLIEGNTELPVISWFYKERARFFVKHPNFNMGRVDKLENGFAWIVDPNGKQLMVELPEGRAVQRGQFIRLAGASKNGVFKGHDMNFCHPVTAQRYYHHMSMERRPMNMHMNMRGHHRMRGRTTQQ